jgi:hypothetical protein
MRDLPIYAEPVGGDGAAACLDASRPVRTTIGDVVEGVVSRETEPTIVFVAYSYRPSARPHVSALAPRGCHGNSQDACPGIRKAIAPIGCRRFSLGQPVVSLGDQSGFALPSSKIHRPGPSVK